MNGVGIVLRINSYAWVQHAGMIYAHTSFTLSSYNSILNIIIKFIVQYNASYFIMT